MSEEREDSIWERPEPGARGAGFSRAQLVATAIAIADREGVKAVSMRRVAAEVGAGTMTLYHYVRNKDELFALVEDTIMSELVIPEGEMPADWRDAITEIATRSRDALIRHPWVFDSPHQADGGPNGTIHFEQSLRAVSGAGLSRASSLEVVAMIDDYVFGYAMRANMMSRSVDGNPETLATEWAEVLEKQLETLDPEAFPNIHDLFTEQDAVEVLIELIAVARDDGRFLRGLNLILDGVERMAD